MLRAWVRTAALVVLALAISMALAGCSASKDGKPASPQMVNYVAVDGTSHTILLAPEAGLISGLVRDHAGNPISSAHVAILGTDLAFVTGPSGTFQFLNLGHGKFTLRVDADGYKSAEAPLTIRAGSVTETRVTLAPLPTVDEPVATPQREAALAVGPEWMLPAFVAGCILMVVLGWWLRGRPGRLLNRAEASLKGGRLAEAESLVRRVLRRSPEDTAAWFLLGAVLIKGNQYRQAIRELEGAATAYDPRMAGLAFLITLAHNRLGQADQARRWLPLVARDQGYWNALRDDPDSMLLRPAVRVPAAPQVDPAYG